MRASDPTNDLSIWQKMKPLNRRIIGGDSPPLQVSKGGSFMNRKEWILPVIACVLAVLVAAGVGVRLLSDAQSIRSGYEASAVQAE